jgi:hypothetical protein
MKIRTETQIAKFQIKPTVKIKISSENQINSANQIKNEKQ